MVHHDRMSPVTRDAANDSNAQPTPGDDRSEHTEPGSAATSSDDEDSDDSIAEPEPVAVRRYPQRVRTQRQIPGAILYDPNAGSSSGSSPSDLEGE